MGSEFSRSDGRARAFFLRSTSFLLTLGFLLFVLLAPSASASPKRIVSELGSPELGQTGAQFNEPHGVAVNQTGAGGVPAGTLYVVDSGNLRIQRFSPSGAFVSAWGFGVVAGNEEIEFCTNAAQCRRGVVGVQEGIPGEFRKPRGIAVDQSNGNVYVGDESASDRRINVFSAKGVFEGAFGWGIKDGSNELQFCTIQTGCIRKAVSNTFKGQGGAFPGAIGGLAVDPSGGIYVANSADNRVDVFKPTLSGGTVTGVTFVRAFGRDVVIAGKPNDVSTEAFEVCDVTKGNVPSDCKAGTAGTGLGQFGGSNASPNDVAVDSEGNIFALDFSNKRVQEFSSAAVPITASFGSAALEGVFGAGATLFNLATDPSAVPNHLLVSGGRIGSGGNLAVAELDHFGNNVLGAGKAHGEDLPTFATGGVAATRASLGGNLYLSSGTQQVLEGVFVLNEVPTIEPVTGITGTTATFHGKVVSNEIDVTYHFEYSTDGKNWTKVPAADLDAGAHPGEVAVQQEVKGLTGSQLYQVRLVQNRPSGGGGATSAVTTFTTLAERPAIQGTVAFPVRDTSATLNAYLNPQNQATSYRFEYGTANCETVPDPCTPLPTSVANGGGLRLITQVATGLMPETVYHFRLVATNATGSAAGPDRAFETFAAGRQLPDDRAYELVTPPDTGSVVLAGGALGEEGGVGCFDTFSATTDGNSVVSISRGGSLPGLDVNGRADLYESVRGPSGWSTIAKSASTRQTVGGQAGLCSSPDHLYSTQSTEAAPLDEGSLVVEGKKTAYIRIPGVANPACTPEAGSHFELVGCGSLGVDAEGNARSITSGATHIIFSSKKQLEPAAPPSGTEAVYDRTPGGPTRVVSLLPGGVPLLAGQNAEYQGASADGSTVAFKVAGTMYARVGQADTKQVAASPNTFAGISGNGRKVFYAATASEPITPAGLFVFDTASPGPATEIAPNSIFVNVSGDGSHVYFVSTSVLTGTERNSQDREAEAGKNNLYVWDGGSKATRFVATVDPKDIEGVEGNSLTRWTGSAVSPTQTSQRGRASDTSRTTPDGSVLLFESRANVTGYDSGGHIEIYRYDAGGGSLDCVSCPPSGAAAAGDAELQTLSNSELLHPTIALIHIQNVTDDGQTVFFETTDALVPGDVNESRDVYEWKAGQQPYLISSGHNQLPSFLYGMTPNGSDVFFTTAERLVPQDLSTVISIYDARVGGGFPLSQSQPPCEGDNCQGTPTAAPGLAGAGSASFQGAENEAGSHKPHCRRNQHRVKRGGKLRCVKKHRRTTTKHHHRTSHNGRAGR